MMKAILIAAATILQAYLLGSVDTVSYTHLDVYKRQLLYITAAVRRKTGCTAAGTFLLESGQNKKRRATARLSKRTLEKLFSSGLDGDFQILVLFTSLCVLSGLILGLFHSKVGETISGQIGHQERCV